jgi:alkanesulfonate monooxygenase SsuD/methylene tetrahydromethanopterin reductase-like flavin-dependent oxidoreductase (luciferase family)
VIIGVAGRRRTPAIAARYANEFNANFVAPAEAAGLYGRVTDACRAEGRDPASMTFTIAHTVCCGKDDADLRRRAAAIGRDPDQLRTGAIAGSPAEIVDRIGQYAEAGASTVYLQVLDLSDLGHLELLAAEVLPQV